jgi:hypothetical protein
LEDDQPVVAAAAVSPVDSQVSTTPPKAKEAAAKEVPKPFQHLQFLVRDWQNFDAEYEEGQPQETFQVLQAEMQKYLSDVLRSRGLNDLQSTREQITRCFAKLDCYMLPHPGFQVTKKNYDGSIARIDPFFRALVNKYVRYVFDEQLEAKVINGRQLSGKELQTYFEVYVKMFQQGQKTFPKAMTMLDATAGTCPCSLFLVIAVTMSLPLPLPLSLSSFSLSLPFLQCFNCLSSFVSFLLSFLSSLPSRGQ